MSQHSGFSAELLSLCGLMRDQMISDQDAQRLNELLAASKDARQFYLQCMSITVALEGRDAQVDAADSDADPDVDLLLDLLKMESAAQAHTVVLNEPKPEPVKQNAVGADSRSAHDLAAVGSYALRLAMTNKSAKRIYAYAGVAAVLLLCFVLFNPWADNDTPDAQPFTDNTPPMPTESAPPILWDTPVATLTATHNAVWSPTSAEHASARGSDLTTGTNLHPNERLTLTAGFAEITTNRGAIAILEAPATIELLENNNALRLHAGKLVGICETESSKGFLVRTPHMDVIDIGTEFGVNADRAGTEVVVFMGAVDLYAEQDASSTGAQPVRLTAGSRSGVDAGGSVVHGFKPISVNDRSRFARSVDPDALAELEYVRVVMGHRPSAYWRFGGLGTEALADTVTDSARLRLVGNAQPVAKGTRHWLKIDPAEGRSAYAELVDAFDAFSGAQAYTIECWIRPRSWTESALLSLVPMDASGDQVPTAAMLHIHDPSLRGSRPRSLRFVHRNPPALSGPHQAQDGRAYPPDTWVHLVAVKTPDHLRLYANGELVATTASKTPMTRQPLRVKLAFHVTGNDDSRQFTGDMDEVALYDHALTEQQVAEHYTAGVETLFPAGDPPTN